MKIQICSDQGYHDIGVVIATKWRHYPFYLQPYFSRHWELFFQNRSRELFSPIGAPLFVKFKRYLWERFRYILRWNFYGSKYSKNWTILMFGGYRHKTKHFWRKLIICKAVKKVLLFAIFFFFRKFGVYKREPLIVQLWLPAHCQFSLSQSRTNKSEHDIHNWIKSLSGWRRTWIFSGRESKMEPWPLRRLDATHYPLS